MNAYLPWLVGVVLLVAAVVLFRKMPRGPKISAALAAGNMLPEFSATDENGNSVSTTELRGKPSVLLFVRGNWCPFCTKQVEKLSAHYKEINDLGARLIFITPKPQETTRRVAEFFEIDFEFWLDESLAIASSLGLVMKGGVPADSAAEYGEDTVWPTAIVADADGKIRYSKLSRYIFDRPDPELLLKQLQKI